MRNNLIYWRPWPDLQLGLGWWLLQSRQGSHVTQVAVWGAGTRLCYTLSSSKETAWLIWVFLFFGSTSQNWSLAGDMLITSLIQISDFRKAFSFYVHTALSLNVLTVLNSVTNNEFIFQRQDQLDLVGHLYYLYVFS